MREIKQVKRSQRLISDTIKSLELDLRGMTVLTEAASGPFAVTALIAAMARADQVFAMARDSVYGTVEELRAYMARLATEMSLEQSSIAVITTLDEVNVPINIVTNLGALRPIRQELISKLPADAAIALMWETWEVREKDIDFAACLEHGIPVLGTNERDERLQIFRYVGLTVLKLLLEMEIEVFKSNILVVSSGQYLEEISLVLTRSGADIKVFNPYWDRLDEAALAFLRRADAIVVADQRYEGLLMGYADEAKIPLQLCSDYDIPIIHIAGQVDDGAIQRLGIKKRPERQVEYGYMTVTTDYVGIRPVIELHGAGLKVGQELVRGLRLYQDVEMAKKYALGTSPAMDF